MNKEKEFVQNFALELTNRTLEEREEIGRKYYQQLQAKEQECEQLRGGQHHQGKIIKELTAECERLKAKIEYVFSDASPNFDYFCDICVAKDTCNGSCCFEQIKELIYEVE